MRLLRNFPPEQLCANIILHSAPGPTIPGFALDKAMDGQGGGLVAQAWARLRELELVFWTGHALLFARGFFQSTFSIWGASMGGSACLEISALLAFHSRTAFHWINSIWILFRSQGSCFCCVKHFAWKANTLPCIWFNQAWVQSPALNCPFYKYIWTCWMSRVYIFLLCFLWCWK
jgi:hypothetical protein